MRYLNIYIILLFILLSGCKEKTEQPPPPPVQDEFIRAVDFSFLPEIEEYQAVFYNLQGNPEGALEIIKNAGCNMVRMRLWHTPSTSHSGLQEVTGFSERVRSMGMKVWLCVHYSDSWADPGKQYIPKKWEDLDFETLKDSVYDYTKMITQRIQPDLIQIGNEVNSGFMWEKGRIGNGDNFYKLLKEGIRAVREVSPDCRIMIHFAGLSNVEWFFQQLDIQKVGYDYIGLSYYPIWHGKDLNAVDLKIAKLGSTSGKKVLIAETAYPFTLGYNDWTTNIIGSDDQIIPEFPATPQGQLDFLDSIKNILKSDEYALGFCYWGGEWIAFKGNQAQDGSSWENQALFDFENKALPVIEVFAKE